MIQFAVELKQEVDDCMNKGTYAVVDLETTGHSPSKGDRIIQIAIVFVENEQIVKKYVKFVDPKRPIPAFIHQLTSISDEDVADAAPFEELAEEVAGLLEGCIFVAHNTDFDVSFLQKEFARCGVPSWKGQTIDTVELTKIMYPKLPSYRLQDIAEELHIPLTSAHRADDDAEATANLLLHCIDKMRSLPRETLALLHHRSFDLKSDVSSLFYEALVHARKKEPKEEFSLFRGIPYLKAESAKPFYGETTSFPAANSEKLAVLQQIDPAYQLREAQAEMMDLTWQALTTKEQLAVEVPTGVGKTVGYLIPAVLHSIRTQQPVVISTPTNHLVDALLEEVQNVRNALSIPFSATVLKGMSNYISLNKFEELLEISEELYDDTLIIMQILVWLTETTTGDLDELNVSGGGQLFIDRIRKQQAKLAKDERAADFHSRLVMQSEQSNIVITNHSMLLADQNRQLPLFHSLGGLIVDEAHHVVQSAVQSKKQVFSYTNWKYVIGQLSTDSEGQLLYSMDQLLQRLQLYREQAKMRLTIAFEQFVQAFDDCMTLLAEVTDEQKKQAVTRIVTPLHELDLPADQFQLTFRKMTEYVELADQYTSPLRAERGRLTKKELSLLNEWDYWIDELQVKKGDWVELFLEETNDNRTVWIEKDTRSLPGSLVIVRSPIHAASVIQACFGPLTGQTGIVWASGTLTVENDPSFVLRQLGLEESVPLHVLEAPPHFYDGASVMIVEDMPDIQQVSQNDFVEAVADALIQTAIATNGRLFALFLSQEMLKKTYDLIMDSESVEGYALIAQGVSSGSRQKLLKSFKQCEQAMLFGTTSFWEGVDVPGEALSAVVIVRLPFTSPDAPLYKAKSALLAEQGKHSFQQLGLPEAILRFRQGFGRLIRSSDERGFFIILDRRIETKSYGKYFLSALPASNIKKVSLEQLVNEIENCYNDDVPKESGLEDGLDE